MNFNYKGAIYMNMTINEKVKKMIEYNLKIEQLLLKVIDDEDFNLNNVEEYSRIPKYMIYSVEKEGLLNEFDVFQLYKIIFNNFNFVFEVIEDEGTEDYLNQLNDLKKQVTALMDE